MQLDTIRALSLLAVVYQHTMNPQGRLLSNIGAMGLMVFFVLSGYLISGLLLEARARADAEGVGKRGVLLRFYIRRFLRIFPLYYAVLGIAVLLGEPTTRAYFLELATYRTNFLMARLGHNIPPVTPLWSLAVEEHFYLFWPVIALFTSRRFVRLSIAAMILGSVVARAIGAASGGTYQMVAMPTWASIDGIAMGCALALLVRDTSAEVRARWVASCLGLGIVLAVAFVVMRYTALPQRRVWTLGLNMIPVGLISVWFIDRAASNRLPHLFNSMLLARLGVVSYGMYMLHRYVMHYLGFDGDRGWVVFASVYAVSALLATLSWLLYESPLNNLKRFWPYVPARPDVTVVTRMAPDLPLEAPH
ncbi:MAG TPA: acyltransferase [Gemmatimonadaceae bacterium]|nr:acyltransferase [Gemmatimonadaceae bacterium]